MRSLVPAVAAVLTMAGAIAAERVRVDIDVPDSPRVIALDRLLGGNVALWYKGRDLRDPSLVAKLDRWKPGLLRLPGGSWSDEIYWNGNGVRDGDTFDLSKRDGHQWKIDYSDYAPGLHLAKADGTLAEFQGHSDVKALHEFVQSRGAAAIVTVNAGTGTPEMAAEWVRWAKKQGYRVDYWEVGNELDGEWELGHVGPDGKVVDADEYARRFVAFAKAMKAVDPTIKVGGPTCSNDQLPFVETLIRESGELLDFVTFHTYPVLGGRKSEAERFEHSDDVSKAVARIRGWISQYQPGREDEIEIGVTEWHKQVMETRPTVDLSSGLWSCLFIGHMAGSGVDFANQWDFFSTVDGGGHGLFGKRGAGARAVFLSMLLWREHMGNEWLTLSGGSESLEAFATRGADGLSVMLVNKSRESVQAVDLVVDGKSLSGKGAGYRLSQREYFWNPQTERPAWSLPATELPVDLGAIELPPFSALVVKPGKTVDVVANETGEPSVEIVMPSESSTDLPAEGFVLVHRKGTELPWQGTLEPLTIEVSGPANAVESKIDVSSSVGRFQLRASGAGESVVRVKSGNLEATATIEWKPVEEREEVIWTFGDAAAVSGLETNYSLALDAQARPNQAVAVAQLEQAKDVPQENTLLAIKKMPESLERDRIGGVVGLLGASPDLKCDDPKAFVQVVLQSNHDHWMVLGRVPLAELRGDWKPLSIRFDDPKLLDAMSELYGVRFHLKSNAPVTGRIYFDDLGFILRGNP